MKKPTHQQLLPMPKKDVPLKPGHVLLRRDFDGALVSVPAEPSLQPKIGVSPRARHRR